MTKSIQSILTEQWGSIPTRNPDGTFLPGHTIGRTPLPEAERTTPIHVRVTPEQKQWLITHGTSETIRTLIVNAMAEE